MTEARWAYSVRDGHGRTRRGRVVYSDNPAVVDEGIGGFAEFLIVLLDAPAKIAGVPVGVAVCMPAPPRPHALRDPADRKFPLRLLDFTLRRPRMAAYAAGRIVMSRPGAAKPGDIFPAQSEHPRLERLALALLEALDAETIAPYTALIRHELRLPPGADAVRELKDRLARHEASRSEKRDVPAISRLAKVAHRLGEHAPPAISLDEMAGYLQYLRTVLDDEPWTPAALERLAADVGTPEAADQPRERRQPAENVVPLRERRRNPARRGDA